MTTSPASDLFTSSQVKTFEHLLNAHLNSPEDDSLASQVLAFRRQMVDLLQACGPNQIQSLFQGTFGSVFRALVAANFSTSPPDSQAAASSAKLAESCLAQSDSSFDVRPLLSCMLLIQAHQIKLPNLLRSVPDWLFDDYLAYLLQAPPVFLHATEADDYAAHMQSCLRALWDEISRAPDQPRTRRAAHAFIAKANFIPLYFANSNTRELATLRASIIEHFLRSQGAAIDASFSIESTVSRKTRVGFLNAHFGQQTETHVALPTFRLDRDRFEVCLFSLLSNPGAVETYCRSLADAYTLLPPALDAQVRTLRAANLDVIIVGTNVTAVTNQVSLIASHRLAPIQLVTYCSPVSTGMRNIDGYISGTLNHHSGLDEHFSEKLCYCDGPPGCLDYSIEPQGTLKTIRRCDLGLPDDAVVFVNAAACFKILPEMQDTWTKILAAIPHARLLLLPFNPNWSRTFPVKQFESSLSRVLRRHGLSSDRVSLAPSLPTRSDVKSVEALADIYLDTFPFSGSISVIDALELGLPTVVWEGETHRSRMASALLRELDLPELIATDQDSYIDQSVALACDNAFRDRLKTTIAERMARRPRFIDPGAYGRQLSILLERLVREHRAAQRLTEASAPQVA